MTVAIYVLAGIGAVTVMMIAAAAIVLITAMIAAAIGEDPNPTAGWDGRHNKPVFLPSRHALFLRRPTSMPTVIRALWVRGALKYHGTATARWASFGAQLQNIKKLKTDDPTGVIKAIYAAERQLKSLRAATAMRPTCSDRRQSNHDRENHSIEGHNPQAAP